MAGATILGLLFMTAGLYGVRSFLTVDDDLSPADAIVVLGGEDQKRMPRTLHAVNLYRAGLAPVVVFSGFINQFEGRTYSVALYSLRQAVTLLRLPESAAQLAPGATSTYEEAFNLNALARENEWLSLIVVTDAFHTRRAGRTFQALLPEVVIRTSPAPDTTWSSWDWWRHPKSLQRTANELGKLAYYWIRYGIAPFHW
jgi:uncharacterized SAM-binding protein YcdF (DUF218 family)